MFSLVLVAGSYFPGRQDLETKWVKCASTVAERGITGRGRVGNLYLPDPQRRSEPLPVGGVHALCHGQHPSTVVGSVRVYDINESAESITLTRNINVPKFPDLRAGTNALRPSSKLLRLLGSKTIGRPDFLVQFRRTLKLPHLASHELQSIKKL